MLLGRPNMKLTKLDKTQSLYQEQVIKNETSWVWSTLGDGFDVILSGNNLNDRIWFSHFVQ